MFTTSYAELKVKWESDHKRRAMLRLSDPEHPTGFHFDEQHSGYDIWWGGYEYFIEFKRINSPLELLIWLQHLTAKDWQGTTSEHICAFIEDVCARRGWNVHAGV